MDIPPKNTISISKNREYSIKNQNNKKKKNEFYIPFLNFLGHRISTDGILMDPKKKYFLSSNNPLQAMLKKFNNF